MPDAVYCGMRQAVLAKSQRSLIRAAASNPVDSKLPPSFILQGVCMRCSRRVFSKVDEGAPPLIQVPSGGRLLGRMSRDDALCQLQAELSPCASCASSSLVCRRTLLCWI